MIDQKRVDQAQELIRAGEALLNTAKADPDPRSRMSRSSGVTSHTRVDTMQWSEWRARSLAFLDLSIGGLGPYLQQFDEYTRAPQYGAVQNGIGVLKAAEKDIAAGNLVRLSERVRADAFSSFLEMAEHLQADGFQDAAAVLGGGVLEGQLRFLCAKNGIPTTSGSRPKKAEIMNTELCSAGIYDMNQQKSVTAWLGIRNDPAHGNYNKYTPQQVALFLAGIRDFIARHPA